MEAKSRMFLPSHLATAANRTTSKVKVNKYFLSPVSQGFKLLGFLDVQNTPCARDAILHGAGGSLAAGLLHFLATSQFHLRREPPIMHAAFRH